MAEHDQHEHDGQQVGYASPQEAMAAPKEEFVYVAALHTNTGVDEPDYLGVVDVNPASDRYGQITHQMPMPGRGDELHHYGWQVCSSACHTDMKRQYMIVPGFRSSRMHIVDVLSDPRRPQITKVIEGDE